MKNSNEERLLLIYAAVVATIATSFTIAAVIILSGCSEPKPLPDPPPVVIVVETGCEAACVRYRALGCEEGEPTEDGTTCEAWLCNAAEIQGMDDRFGCVVDSDTCEAARECETR